MFSDILSCVDPLPGADSVGRGLTLTNKMLLPHQQACCCCCVQSSKGKSLHMLTYHRLGIVSNARTSEREEKEQDHLKNRASTKPHWATGKGKCSTTKDWNTWARMLPKQGLSFCFHYALSDAKSSPKYSFAIQSKYHFVNIKLMKT